MTVWMFLFGAYALIFGRFVLTRRRVVYGTEARIVGVLLALGLPVGVLIELIAGSALDAGYVLTDPVVHLSVGIVFLVAALAVAIKTAKPLPKKRQLLAEAEQALAYFGDGHSGSRLTEHSGEQIQPPTEVWRADSPPCPGDQIQR